MSVFNYVSLFEMLALFIMGFGLGLMVNVKVFQEIKVHRQRVVEVE